jgi:diadenosine tetraphosphate (Ap4A) HIT family hydrolase
VLQNNEAEAHQAVMHVHFHVIPKPSADVGLGVRWPAGGLDQAEAPALAERLRLAIVP